MAARPLAGATPDVGTPWPDANGHARGAASSCWCVGRAGSGRAGARHAGTDLPALRCLIVDNQPAARDDLAAMLRGRACVGPVSVASDAIEALRLLGRVDVDVVFVEARVGPTTKLLPLSAVRWAEACHDYVRLYTADGCYLIRARLTALVDSWQPYGGPVRIHRSYLVGPRFVAQLHRVRSGQFAVVIDGRQLPVSRRYLPLIRERWGLVVGPCAG